ncbi:hypothetical protein JCM14469_18100 [Desulfatiferula olefinivorans]
MSGNEAGASSSPTGRVKCFICYFLVFAVAAALIVQASASHRETYPAGTAALGAEPTVPLSIVPPETEADSILHVLIDEQAADADADDLAEINDPETLYYPLIVKVARRYEVDPLLVKAIIAAESGFNPNAVSHVGAQGLMQLMPRTAKALGVEDAFNPEHNIDGGVKYFRKLLDRFDGDVQLALAAYNAGSRKVHKYRGVPPFSETRNYIEKVFKFHTDFKKVEAASSKTVYLSQS